MLAILALLMCFALWMFNTPVRLSKLNNIREGVTQEEVKCILGVPTRVIPGGRQYKIEDRIYTTTEQWIYSRPLQFGFLNITWTTNKTYATSNYERF